MDSYDVFLVLVMLKPYELNKLNKLQKYLGLVFLNSLRDKRKT